MSITRINCSRCFALKVYCQCKKLIILYVDDIDSCKKEYEKDFDLEFVREKHGNGPVHYFCRLGDGFLFEIYPDKKES